MGNQRNIETPAARKIVLSRGLPKTGQVTSYNAGDDGDLEAGWWTGRLNANNKARYRLTTIAGDAVVTDLATGLMWAAEGDRAGCNYGVTINWSLGLSYARDLTFAGFTDWRVPNVKELFSLVEHDAGLFVAVDPLIQQPPFSNTVMGNYWSATTRPGNTTTAMQVSFVACSVQQSAKTSSLWLRCVRKGL